MSIDSTPFYSLESSLSEKNLIWIAGFMSLLGFITLDLIFPSLPAMQQNLHASTSTMQWSASLFLLGYGFSQLFYGPLSDKYGRKPILIFGLCIYILGTLVCLFTNDISIFLSGRITQGLGIGAAALLSRVILRDCLSGSALAKVTSYTSAFIITGISIAPVCGGFIQFYLGYQANLLFLLVYATAFLLFIINYLPETNLFKKSFTYKNILHVYIESFATRNLTSCVLLCSIGLSIIINYSLFNPFFLQSTLNYNAFEYGLITLIISSGEIFGSYLNGKLIDKFNLIKLIILGILLILIAGVVLVFFNYLLSPAPLIFGCAIASMGTAFIFANAISSVYASFNDQYIGTSGALFGCLQLVGAGICTCAFTMMDIRTVFALGLLFVCFSIFGFLICFRLDHTATKEN